MNPSRSITVFALALAVNVRLASGQQPPKPNIVYIVSDDQGWKDLGYHGSDIRTPNIDSLARGGVRLEQYYAAPFCTPSRAALLTGRYPFRYGLQTAAIPGGARYGLATDEWLLPQALKAAGYYTAIVGKWHLGHADRMYWPRQRGFDYQYGAMVGELDYYTHAAHGVRDWYRNNQPVNEPGYVTTLIGQDAVRVIAAHDPKVPLFLYLTFTAPHAPYQAPQTYLDRYQNIADPTRRAYAAMISAMDDEIGKVVAALERRGMRDNTLIVFQSDNGGNVDAMYSGEVDVSQLKLPADNGPFRGGKGTPYEGGIRVPMLVNWPGHLKAGSVVDQPIHTVDMFPTLAALAGASTTDHKPLDGVNVWSTIAGGAPSPRTEIVYDIEPFRAAVRQGDWKLVWRTILPTKVELFNLAQDPSEQTNLADQNPQRVAELQQRVEALSREAVAPLFLTESYGAVKRVLLGTMSTPEEVMAADREP
ncbi:MAG TPA: arylsulfatase [Gemmatimonadales bacterium]|nr:arylsulfatase [Gemmatimonadales bacterium]